MESDGEPHSSSPMDDLLLTDGELESDGGALEDEHSFDVCHICENKMKTPKVLACLHEFCEGCLTKFVEEQGDKSSSSPIAKEWSSNSIVCPTCDQKTTLPEKGVHGLQSDMVLENMIEADSDEAKQIECTSCKAGDNAVARCRTCENLLCPNCVTAHQFMRCFEDHQVVTFEDMISSGEGIEHLRRPIFCSAHSVETIKFFCSNCMMPVCNECVQKSHSGPEHAMKQLSDSVTSNKETLMSYTAECGKKLEECQKKNSTLTSNFEELEIQKDSTKGLIEETFQSYKAILEETRDSFLKDLDDLHKKRELSLMESMEKLSKFENRLSQAKTFVERVCEHGHAGQIAQMLRGMLLQLDTLFKGFKMPDIPANTEFKTDSSLFLNAVKSTFGRFLKEEAEMVKQGTAPSLFGNFPNGAENKSLLPSNPSLEMMNLGIPGMSVNLGVGQRLDNMPMSNVISSLSSMSIGQNPEGKVSGDNSPLSDSGISVDTASHGSGGNTAAMMNAAAMAKLQQAQSPLFAPGMGLPSYGTGATAITSGAGDNSLATILGSNTPVSNSGNTSAQNANLEGLATLLNQPPPTSTMSFSNMQTFGRFNPNAEAGGECSSPDSLSGEPYPPVRRVKMNAMEISRFQGGVVDTEIGHWGPQRFQVNEVTLRCKFGQLGPSKGQFNSPHGFCLGLDEEIVVADTNNHRIQVFQKTGDFKYQFGIPGREEGQLWYPRKVAVILKTGKFIVCDRGNERSRMQIFNRNGHFLRKIAIRYIDIVAGLAITPEGFIVAVDSVSPTVFWISEVGDLVKWFDCSDYMREPSDIAIDNNEYFVCDFKGHCVVVFGKDGGFLRRIGCENITNYPNGIDVSDHGDVLVGDSHGNRFHVGVFHRDGSLLSEYQCPYVKVSRCCGLKITSEGYIVTLAKNNHHVLVLNTLYIL